jgi:hypothetical protein
MKLKSRLTVVSATSASFGSSHLVSMISSLSFDKSKSAPSLFIKLLSVDKAIFLDFSASFDFIR